MQCESETGLHDTKFFKSKTIFIRREINSDDFQNIRAVRTRFEVEQINLQLVTFSVCLFVPYHLENG